MCFICLACVLKIMKMYYSRSFIDYIRKATSVSFIWQTYLDKQECTVWAFMNGRNILKEKKESTFFGELKTEKKSCRKMCHWLPMYIGLWNRFHFRFLLLLVVFSEYTLKIWNSSRLGYLNNNINCVETKPISARLQDKLVIYSRFHLILNVLKLLVSST